MRVALAQTDCVLGDFEANLETARAAIKQAAAQDADLVIFPELNLHGYTLGALDEDVSVAADDRRVTELSEIGPDILVGLYEDGDLRRYNSAVYVSGGRVVHVHRKLFLPTYLTWEERKHFTPGQAMRAFDTRFGRMAVLVCNDFWQPVLPWLAVQDGAYALLTPTNSVSTTPRGTMLDNVDYWQDLLRHVARMQQTWVGFVNRVGEERGATFWGGSRLIDPLGSIVAQAPMGEPAVLVADIDLTKARWVRRTLPLISEARLGLVQREVKRLVDEGGDV
ncbi:MAG: amidohydrolase [Actinophytocola sp.]|uniref:nitrilase-related carbon-nitrogen hydrolase n=1 Tax=Actinophytocola sp. TaxID=1872138 RepID=UPI0013292684|nr:nitrilase-related carbon-nitrogen hydrolase [Actinophytocola sp.]MPZ80897.1 amidohydrolase [Actinophytocola sp.]